MALEHLTILRALDYMGKWSGSGHAHGSDESLELLVELTVQAATGIGQMLAHVANTLTQFRS